MRELLPTLLTVATMLWLTPLAAALQAEGPPQSAAAPPAAAPSSTVPSPAAPSATPEETKQKQAKSAGSVDAAHRGRQTEVTALLQTYCLDCHSREAAEGQREFESLTFPFRSESQLITADEIVDQLTLKTMPPEDSPQPTDQERLRLLQQLRAGISEARDHLDSTGGRTVMRRLSNREYENTLAVLFDRRVDTLGLTADFPSDSTLEHMDNIGDTLVTSGFLLDQYFQAASRLVDLRLGKPETAPRKWHFTDNFRQYEELTGAHKSVFNYEYLCLYEQPNTDTRQGGYGHIEDFLEGVPVSGLYDISIHAQAMHRDTHYDPKIFRIDFSEPFQVAVVPGDARKGHIHYPQAIEPVLGTAIVPDDEPEWITFRVWLDAGQTPRFIFPNGPYESRASVISVNKRYRKEFEGKGFRDGVSRAHILRHGALPHIKIGEVKIHGPLAEPHGGKEERSVFGEQGFDPDRALEQVTAFAAKAWRRPLQSADRDRLQDLFERRVAEGATPREAALDTVKLILCSPSFLYLSEITQEPSRLLGAHDLASRLSFALWCGPPDERLRAAARSGDLLKADMLNAQIERMLADERSSQFISGFLESWLNLRDIGNQPPSRRTYWSYYSENLPASMKQEVRLFFRHLLDEDGTVMDLVNADYTFVDKNLAKLYQLPEQKTLRQADGFQKVSLADSKQRGGLLGMAAVLTVSANGVETSPVTRGVWVSENLLGVIPPPPPDEVPAIESNVSGATTIREKLALHSSDQSCKVCHRRIDPFGHALESFDPVGRWRTKYPKQHGKTPAVDPSGRLPTGEAYGDFRSFRHVLTESQSDKITRNVVRKLLMYATGRRMERADEYEIDDIVQRVHRQGDRLRPLVVEVLTSQIFRSR